MSETSTEEYDYDFECKISSLGEFEEKYGTSWLSACYPLNHESVRNPTDRRYNLHNLATFQLKPLLESALREAPGDLLVSGEPCPATDIVSLLSLSDDGDHDLVRNNGERVLLNAATFRGKYVLVCCINVPVLLGTRYFECLLDLCYELFSMRDDFEMVIVARMNPLTDTRAVFDHFLSGFPESVLAVPYEYSTRRHQICNLLDLSPELDCFQYLILDTDGSVLPSSIEHEMACYGAEAFPFTRDILDGITAKERELEKNGTLEQLLRPYDSSPDDVSVYKFNDPHEVVNFSQLGNKHVGLFICFGTRMNIISRLNTLYKQCKEKQLDFEIVVLYCPLGGTPESFKEGIDRLLQKEGVCGWWCVPFNNSVSLQFDRLKKICRCTGECQCYDNLGSEDELIIAGPGGKILDMCGAMCVYDGVDAYPFTREAVADMKMKKKMKMNEKLREITLKSVLGDVYRGDDCNDAVSADQLCNGEKKVILYINDNASIGNYENYLQIKTREGLDTDQFEVIIFDTGLVGYGEAGYEEDEIEAGEEEDEIEYMEIEAGEEEDEIEAGYEEDENEDIINKSWCYMYPESDGTGLKECMRKLLEYGYHVYEFGLDGRISSHRGLREARDKYF